MGIPGLEFKHIISANGDYNSGSAQTGNRLTCRSNGGITIPEYSSPAVKDWYGFALNRLGENIDQMA